MRAAVRLDFGARSLGGRSRAAPARRACRASSRGRLRRSALLRELSVSAVPEPLEELELVDAAAQVSAWCGEPLLYDGDDPASTLAPGTARRRALDAAREEIAQGGEAPSPAWRFRFSLMLGLERVLAEDQPALLNGLTLRPHQVDALAGMLAALTSAEEREEAEDDELNGADELADEAAEDDSRRGRRGRARRGRGRRRRGRGRGRRGQRRARATRRARFRRGRGRGGRRAAGARGAAHPDPRRRRGGRRGGRGGGRGAAGDRRSRARSAATASSIPRHRARRWRRPASWRPAGRSAC